MSIRVQLSEEELILNALARVKHPKGERDVVAHSQREMEAIRPILDTLRASAQAMAEAVRKEARAEGFKQGQSCAIDLAQKAAERRGAERALRWAADHPVGRGGLGDFLGAIADDPKDQWSGYVARGLAATLPTDALDRVREEARREGFNAGRSCAIDLAQKAAARRGATEALRLAWLNPSPCEACVTARRRTALVEGDWKRSLLAIAMGEGGPAYAAPEVNHE